MEKFNSENIKIGILKDIRKEIVKGKVTIGLGGLDRGIIYEETTPEAHDILFPELYYPYYERRDYKERTSVIGDSEPLTPLLDYYGMSEFTSEELNSFVKEYLSQVKWLRSIENLFGIESKNFGPIHIATREGDDSILPYDLYQMIDRIQSDYSFDLTRNDKKRLRRTQGDKYEL